MKIKTKNKTRCPSCGYNGKLYLENLKDRFFNTPGLWANNICKCGTIWLNPAPEDFEIYKLYLNYSTHKSINLKTVNKENKILNRIRKVIFNKKLKHSNKINALDKFLEKISYIHPAWRDTQLANNFYIPKIDNGNFLDIGCGAGNAMYKMKRLGWNVVGLDFDENAVKASKEIGLNVINGSLLEQSFPDNNFDAILMNHVIEHMDNPLKIIEECKRILKENGILVMITPNAKSIGRYIFSRNWRGLEVPQHINLFSPKSLSKICKNSGFKYIKAFSGSHSNHIMFVESLELLAENRPILSKFIEAINNKVIKNILWLILGWITKVFPTRGETSVVICKK